MEAWLRACLQLSLKIVNSVIGLVGMAMILYSLWMIRDRLRQMSDLSHDFSGSTPSWFVPYPFRSYQFPYRFAVIISLLMLEAAITADIFLNRNWEEDFPRDPSGRFNQFEYFVRSNSGMCKWIGLLIVAVEVFSVFLAMVLRSLGPDPRVYDDSDDDTVTATLPLLRNQFQGTPYTPNPNFSVINDYWNVRIHDKVSK